MIHQLFDIETIKSKSYLHGNISDEKLLVLVERVQDVYLQDLLSTGLYEHLQNNYNTLNVKELELLNKYVLPCFLTQLEIKALYEFTIDYRNSGVGGVLDNNLSQLSKSDLDFHVENKRKELMIAEKLLIDYLSNNSGDFPMYNTGNGLTGKNNPNFKFYML